jgi:hypothetical protein
MDAAVDKRTKFAASVSHYEKKLAEEQAKEDAAKETAALIQQEFVVGSHTVLSSSC